jgi:hypothetical protein
MSEAEISGKKRVDESKSGCLKEWIIARVAA